jgi:hypothetical protein
MRVLNLPKLIPVLAFSLPALVLAFAVGCAKKPFAVEVPRGFTGYVHIFCGARVGFPSQPVRVNSLGGAEAESCPGSDAKVSVFRDGRAVAATAVIWERAGDGTPAALSFNVY